MYVTVQYYRSGVYAGNYYAYETDLDLREGDKVTIDADPKEGFTFRR